MSDSYITIVPKVKDFKNRQAKAKEILDWLISKDIVNSKKSDSVLGSTHGYSVSSGAKNIVEYPNDIPFDLWTNGLDIILENQVFHSGQYYEEGDILPESNLGFTFWNWPDFKSEFLLEFKAKLGEDIEVINGCI